VLFSERSLWTMIHGIGLGGGALLALAAVLFAMLVVRPRPGGDGHYRTRPIAWMAAFAAIMTWLTTIVGTYVIFPPYRATPPEGTTDLSEYPRALILGNPDTEWLHRYAMETKEHLPFIAAMLATAVAFVAWRYRDRLLGDASLRRLGVAMLALSFAMVAYLSLLGVFVNKVAPLD
jgi:hypothetical protein